MAAVDQRGAERTLVAINADTNLGGRITGGSVGLEAKTDDPAFASETVNFSQLMAGIAGALVGGDQASADIAAAAGANAVENNQFGVASRALMAAQRICIANPALCAGAAGVALQTQLRQRASELQQQTPGLSYDRALDVASTEVIARGVVNMAINAGSTVASWFEATPASGARTTPGYGAGDLHEIENSTGGISASPYYGNNTGGTQLVDPDLIGTQADGGFQSFGPSGASGTTRPITGPLIGPVVMSENNGINLPIPAPTTAVNGLQIESNRKHTPGNAGYSPTAGTEPRNSLELFNNSVAGGEGVRYALDDNGAINRFFDNGNGAYHWSGSTSDANNPLRPESIPISIRRAFGFKR